MYFIILPIVSCNLVLLKLIIIIIFIIIIIIIISIISFDIHATPTYGHRL